VAVGMDHLDIADARMSHRGLRRGLPMSQGQEWAQEWGGEHWRCQEGGGVWEVGGRGF
jgi:hypothetical protein